MFVFGNEDIFAFDSGSNNYCLNFAHSSTIQYLKFDNSFSALHQFCSEAHANVISVSG